METQTLQSKHQLVTIGISRMMYLTLLTFLLVQVSIAQTVHTVDNRPESGAMYTTVATAICCSYPRRYYSYSSFSIFLWTFYD